VPESVFGGHDEDFHAVGSGAIILITHLGGELAKQGRLRVGDLVWAFPFETDPNDPVAAADPSFASPKITGFETPYGMAAEFASREIFDQYRVLAHGFVLFSLHPRKRNNSRNRRNSPIREMLRVCTGFDLQSRSS
jgi:hypothetical protein